MRLGLSVHPRPGEEEERPAAAAPAPHRAVVPQTLSSGAMAQARGPARPPAQVRLRRAGAGLRPPGERPLGPKVAVPSASRHWQQAESSPAPGRFSLMGPQPHLWGLSTPRTGSWLCQPHEAAPRPCASPGSVPTPARPHPRLWQPSPSCLLHSWCCRRSACELVTIKQSKTRLGDGVILGLRKAGILFS